MKFIKKYLSLIILSLLFQINSWSIEASESEVVYGGNTSVGKVVNLNGINIYYEIYGDGYPLLLIHGNGGSIADMKHQIAYFSKNYRVIVADNRGHGKSDLGTEHLTYVQMSDDSLALLDYLKVESTSILGWSDGGIIALKMAIKRPLIVQKMSIMGANLQPDEQAVYPWARDWVKKQTMLADSMIRKNDITQDWRLMRQQLGLLGEQPNIPLADLQKITAPVLILAGDKDVIREEHTILIFQNIPNAHLGIFPGETHMIPSTNPKLFNETVSVFFKRPFTRPDTKDFFK